MAAETVTEAPTGGDTGTTFVSLGGNQRRKPTAEPTPGASEVVNLVSLLEKAEKGFAAKMGARAWDLYIVDVRSRADRMKKIAKFLEYYASLIKARGQQWQSNINLPVTAYPILQVQARLYDMTWPENGKLLYAAPSTPDDRERAEATELFGNSYIRTDMPEMEQGMDDTLFQMCLVGSAFRRTYWDAYEQKACSDWIAMEDFVVNAKFRSPDPSMRGVPRYTLLHHMTVAEIEALGDAGVYENTDKLVVDVVDAAEGNELADTRSKLDGTSSQADSDDPDRDRMVLEMHCRWRLPDAPNVHPAFDGKNHYVIVTFDEPTKRVFSVVLREEDHPKDARRFAKEKAQVDAYNAYLAAMTMPVPPGQPVPDLTAPPLQPPRTGIDKVTGKAVEPKPVRKREVCFFTHYRAFPSEGFYGLGFGDFCVPLNEAGNRLLNQHIDGVTVRNSKPGFISRQLKMQRGSISTEPGKLTEIDGPTSAMKDGIMFVDAPMNDPTTMPLVRTVLELGDKLAGSADLMSGSTSGSNRTAKEIQILNAQLMKQITVLARRVKGALRHELDKLWRIWGVFLPEEPEDMPVVDPATGEPKTIPITRHMFVPDAKVTPAADPRMQFEKVEEAQQKLGAVVNNPIAMQNPVALWEATAEHLRALGADRILAAIPKPQPPAPPQPVPFWEEEAGWLEGRMSPVHPADVHLEHMQMHQAFLQQHGPMLPPQAVEAIMGHLRAHQGAMHRAQFMPPGAMPPGPQGPPQGPPGPPQMGPGPGGPPPQGPLPGGRPQFTGGSQ